MRDTIIRLQKELLKIKLENLKMQGNLLRVSRRLLEEGLTHELEGDLNALITNYKINRKELIDYMVAMNIGPDETSDPEVKRILEEEKQRLTKECKKEELLQDVTSNSDVQDPLGFGIVITGNNLNLPGVIMQRSINENNIYDKELFIDIIRKMNYKEFKSFCDHVRKLQEFTDFNSGVWVTDVPHKIRRENLNLFWQLSYPYTSQLDEDDDDGL
jgi:hypothetical protein